MKSATGKRLVRISSIFVAFTLAAVTSVTAYASDGKEMQIGSQPTLESRMSRSVLDMNQRTSLKGETVGSQTIPFAHPLDIGHAKTVIDSLLNQQSEVPAIGGVEYRQDNIYGQFIPHGDKGFTWFENYFHTSYGTEPELYGIVLAEPMNLDQMKSDAQAGRKASIQNVESDKTASLVKKMTQHMPAFDAAPAQNLTGNLSRPAGEPKSSTTPLADGQPDWAGSRAEVSMLRQTGSSALQTKNTWYPSEGRDIKKTPVDWAMEFDIKTYATNQLPAGSTWIEWLNNQGGSYETCGLNHVPTSVQGEYFQQHDAVVSEITIPSGTKKDPEPYFDNINFDDPCETLDTTMGLGRPNNVIGDNPQVNTNIITDAGGTASGVNDFIYYYQLVSNDCPIGKAQAACTGLLVDRKLPWCETGKPDADKCDRSRYVVNKGEFKTPGMWAWRAKAAWKPADVAAVKGACTGWQEYPYDIKCPV